MHAVRPQEMARLVHRTGGSHCSYQSRVHVPSVRFARFAISYHLRSYEAGIQTFDTADVYSSGESEVILGNAIKKLKLPREEIVVMTKLYGVVTRDGTNALTTDVGRNPDAHGYVNQHGLSRKHIFDAVKASLKRLQLDYIDVYQCHRFDYNTPIEETMQALHDIVKAGYVRYIGMSSCWAYQFHAMQIL